MRRILMALALTTMLGGCVSKGLYSGVIKEARTFRTPAPIPTQHFPVAPPYPSWTEIDEAYRFYPGDEIEIQVIGATELSRTLIVGPDGRIYPQLLEPIMAGDRTPQELRATLEQGYARQLKNPTINIIPKTFVSQKIFIGGEVSKPGIYELNGEIDPLQAIILAGGFMNSAKREEIVVLRRGAGGQPFMRTYDLKSVFASPESFAQLPRLRRFDVIWVPRTRVSEVGLFTQQFLKDALPITLGFNYSINSGRSF